MRPAWWERGPHPPLPNTIDKPQRELARREADLGLARRHELAQSSIGT